MNKALIVAVAALVLVAVIGKFALGQRKKMVAIEAVGAAVVLGGITYVATRGKA